MIPLIRGESGGVYARSKLLAERAVSRHGGKIVRLAFTTPQQVAGWTWANAYSMANRWWVEDASSALVEAALDAGFMKTNSSENPIRELGPATAITPAELLSGRFPTHPALSWLVETPDEMAKLVGYAAPKDSRFADRRNGV